MRSHRAAECPDCHVHPSEWKTSLGGRRNAVVPEWVFCRVCELIGHAHNAGPPVDNKDAPGWRLSLQYTDPPTEQEAPPDGR